MYSNVLFTMDYFSNSEKSCILFLVTLHDLMINVLFCLHCVTSVFLPQAAGGDYGCKTSVMANLHQDILIKKSDLQPSILRAETPCITVETSDKKKGKNIQDNTGEEGGWEITAHPSNILTLYRPSSPLLSSGKNGLTDMVGQGAALEQEVVRGVQECDGEMELVLHGAGGGWKSSRVDRADHCSYPVTQDTSSPTPPSSFPAHKGPWSDGDSRISCDPVQCNEPESSSCLLKP